MNISPYTHATEMHSRISSTSAPSAPPLSPTPSAVDGHTGPQDRWGSFDEKILINFATFDGFWGQSASFVLPSPGLLDCVVDSGCSNIHQPSDWAFEPSSAIFPNFCPSGDSHFLNSSAPPQFSLNIFPNTQEEPLAPSPVDIALDDVRRWPAIIFIPPSDETPQDARPSQLKKRWSAQARRGRQSDGVPYPLARPKKRQKREENQEEGFRFNRREAETKNTIGFEDGNRTVDCLSSGVSPFERDDESLTRNGFRRKSEASKGVTVKKKRVVPGTGLISLARPRVFQPRATGKQAKFKDLSSTIAEADDIIDEDFRRKCQSSTHQRFGSYKQSFLVRQTCFNADGSKNTIHS